MYKYFTNNTKEVILSTMKNTNQKNLAQLKASDIIKTILKKNGCYGKNIFTSLKPNLKKQLLEILKNDSQLTARKLILKASELAYLSNSHLVGTEHLAQVFIDLELPLITNNSKSTKTQLINNQNIFNKMSDNQNHEEINKEIDDLLKNLFPSNVMMNSSKHLDIIETYCTNLNNLDFKKQTLIGKKTEIERLIHILGRKNKNNPILIGDPGVGKTAIVEGLAEKINNLDVPDYLMNKKIMLLDLSQLIAGTTFRGEFEARLKNIVHTVKKNGDIILFIDEIHTLMGAGNATGGMDAANILKPAMARGEIHIIGATTIDEYKQHIEKDAALERRLQPIIVKEASLKETQQILQGIKKHYEDHHQVCFDNTAIKQIPLLAKKYITNRFLPDSAIDLLDETAARKKATMANSAKLKKHFLKKQRLKKLSRLKESLILENKYQKALDIKQNEIALIRQLQTEKELLKKYQKTKKATVLKKDILETLSLITGISLELLSKHNSKLPSKITATLKQNLVGQQNVKNKINETILRRLAGLSKQKKPLGSFLFIGPTGVGKTMTAKLLAKSISPNEEASLIQINMSEFTEKHSLSKLLGAPAGYVGYENSGELSNKILRNPFSVVLFDEIEKADPNILNILLQILEEGEIVDSKNKRLNFKNTIIILTSNIGTNKLNATKSLGFNSEKQKRNLNEKDKIKKSILSQLKKEIQPELLGRLDNILIFDSLNEKDIKTIIRQHLDKLKQVVKKKGFVLEIDNSIVKLLARKSLAINQGARLIHQNIQNIIEPLVAKKILQKNNKNKKETKKIKLTVSKGKIVIL